MDATYDTALLRLARKVNHPPVDPEIAHALSQLEPRHLRGYPGSQQGQRGMVAELLEEHGHKDQADLLRDEEHPVEVHDGRVKSALWKQVLGDSFLHSYLDTALELSVDDDDPELGSLEANGAGFDDIHPDTLRKVVHDADAFKSRLPGYLREQVDANPAVAGYHLYLSRNNHGHGFFGGDWKHGNRLQAHAEQMGEHSLYRGDDGMVHGG